MCRLLIALFFVYENMKDIIKRLVIGVISGALLGYLAFLFIQGTVIVQSGYTQYVTLYYFILAVICLILFVFFAVHPVHFRMTKATLFVIGIALILIGKTVLLNDAATMVYV